MTAESRGPRAIEELLPVKPTVSRAVLRITELAEGPAIVKDFGPKGWLFRRYLGPFLLNREERAYRRLAGTAGFPRYYRRLSRQALAIERVSGRTFNRACATELPPSFYELLQELVSRMHARGVVHLDLHQKRNIVVSDLGEPVVIDFASSLRFPMHGWRASWMRLFCWIDRLAVLKFRDRYASGTVSDAERRYLRRVRRLGLLWPPRWLNALRKRLRRLQRVRAPRSEASRNAPPSRNDPGIPRDRP